jgi:hypothetical protein
MAVDAYKASHNLNVVTRLSRRMIRLCAKQIITGKSPFDVTRRRIVELC